MNDEKAIARCEVCNELIYEDDDFYMDEEKNYFCCLECALFLHGISRSENYNGQSER